MTTTNNTNTNTKKKGQPTNQLVHFLVKGNWLKPGDRLWITAQLVTKKSITKPGHKWPPAVYEGDHPQNGKKIEGIILDEPLYFKTQQINQYNTTGLGLPHHIGFEGCNKKCIVGLEPFLEAVKDHCGGPASDRFRKISSTSYYNRIYLPDTLRHNGIMLWELVDLYKQYGTYEKYLSETQPVQEASQSLDAASNDENAVSASADNDVYPGTI